MIVACIVLAAICAAGACLWWGVVSDRDGLLIAALAAVVFGIGTVVGSVLG